MDVLLWALAERLIWVVVGAAATVTVQQYRRARAEKAREDARVEAEFGPTLARWRAANEASRHLRPSWLPAATGVWARARLAARAAVVRVRSRVARVLSRIRPASDTPVVTPPPVWTPAEQTDRDVNTFVWPTNPVATGRAAVNVPAELALDFAERIRLENALLHQSAELRRLDPDATGLLPAQSGGAR